MKQNFAPIILMADDDPDDRMLMKEALEENSVPHLMDFVVDGAELLDYLHKRGKFLNHSLRPNLIILDLNRPRHIKSHVNLKRIPVVILTTSKAEEGIITAYDLGVNSFIRKPVRFDELVEVAREIGKYWFGTVALPRI